MKRQNLTDTEFAQLMAGAAQKNLMMTRTEKEAGFAPPQNCDLHCHLRTVEQALECGVRTHDWHTVCEGIDLLRQAIARVMPEPIRQGKPQ